MNRRAFLALPLAALRAPRLEVTICRESMESFSVYWTDRDGWHLERTSSIGEAATVARRVLLRDAA